MYSLERLMLFVKVVEANSYVAVANILGLSRAAISKQISQLEQELNTKLLHRTTRRLQLTESGKLYYEQCKKILEIVEETNQLMFSINEEPIGQLKIICPRFFAQHYILPYLDEFLLLYPKVKLQLELAERIPDPYQEEIDLVIGMSIPGPPTVIQRTIGKTRYVFCASPSYLNQYGIPYKPSDLIYHRYITHSMRHPDYLLTFPNDVHIQVDPIMRLNDVEAMIACALKGIGLIKLHDYAVKSYLANGQLIEVLHDYSQEEFSLYLYYTQNQYLAPKIRFFIDFLLNKLYI